MNTELFMYEQIFLQQDKFLIFLASIEKMELLCLDIKNT